jgi:hypothetical protein
LAEIVDLNRERLGECNDLLLRTDAAVDVESRLVALLSDDATNNGVGLVFCGARELDFNLCCIMAMFDELAYLFGASEILSQSV